jgi:hypothetical protein
MSVPSSGELGYHGLASEDGDSLIPCSETTRDVEIQRPGQNDAYSRVS